MLAAVPILLQPHQPEKQRIPHLRFLAPALPEQDLVQGPEPAAQVEAEPTQAALQQEPELKQTAPEPEQAEQAAPEPEETAPAQVEQELEPVQVELEPVQAEQELAQAEQEPVQAEQELVLEQAQGPEAKDRSKHYFLKKKDSVLSPFSFDYIFSTGQLKIKPRINVAEQYLPKVLTVHPAAV